jgi:hypothetical protein
LINRLLIFVHVAFGFALLFWHRRLMVRLNATHPAVWKRLGREDMTRLFWRLSLRVPIWSFASILFFIRKRYKELDDTDFVREAGRFRLAFLVWLTVFLITMIVSFVIY